MITKEKLKTLKDIYDGYDDERRNLIDKEELKAEAVKWVKYYDKKREESGNLRGEWEKNWIKHFFNLTKEDLK